MDQRSTIGSSGPLDGPIHRACVVPGCRCGSTITAGARSAEASRTRVAGNRTIRNLAAASADLTAIALRSVGLPVV